MCSSSSHHFLGHVPTVFQRVPYISVGTWNTPDNAVTSRNLGTRSRPPHTTEHNHHPARTGARACGRAGCPTAHTTLRDTVPIFSRMG